MAVVRDEPGTLAELAGIIARQHANILNLRLTTRDGGFHAFELDLEVTDVHHLMSIISALRASDVVASADRVKDINIPGRTPAEVALQDALTGS